MKQLISIWFLCFTLHFSIAQSLVTIPGITTQLTYTTINESVGVALMGGVENYISFDQGVTWTDFDNSVGTPLANVKGIDATIINDSTYCIVVVNNNGYSYSIARTTNSGATWVLLNTQNSSIYEMGAIQSNGNNVVVAAKNGVHYSVDGGATWAFVTLSTGYEISKFVDFNTGSNTWFVGAYSNDIWTSTNQGASWTAVNYGVNSSQIVNSSNIGNQLLLTHAQPTGGGGRFLRIDSSNNLVDTIEVPAGILASNVACKEANYLPNGDILASNLNRFYRIDTSNNYVYTYDFPNIIWSGNYDIALGSNYGMALRNGSTNIGEPYRVNYSVTPVFFLPANINMFNESSTCAGDDIVCAPYAYYADSVKWHVNGSFYTSNVNLVYPTPPGVFTSYMIQLFVYYNGIMKTQTKTVTFTSPQPPHPFTYQIDTSGCYGQPFHVFINPDNGTPQNTSVAVYYGGQLVAGPSQMTTSNMNLYTVPLFQDDTLEIIAYNNGACNLTSNTITQFIDVGPDLFDFSVLPNDSAICIGVNPTVSLVGTDSTFLYNFSSSSSFVGYVPTNYQSSGAEADTLNATINGGASTILTSTSTDTYQPMYVYASVQVTDTMGCVDTELIDTFRIHRPTAYIDLHSRSYYKYDTMGLSNAFVTDNRTWSSNEFPSGYVMNNTDTVPLIVSDITGFFDVQLKNEPVPGCVDSTTEIIHYAEPAVLMDTACSTNELEYGGSIHIVEHDQFGNIYEVGTNCHPQNFVPLYFIRKYDQFGVFQWEKKGVSPGWGFGDITGIVIDAIDFDCEGNPIIGMWISGEDDFTDDYFDFQPNQQGTFEIWSYVGKVDKNTGDLIWRTKLNDYLTTDNFWRITDLVTDNGRIHVSAYKHLALEFSTFDMDGNFISSEPFPFSSWTQTPFIRPSFHCGGGSWSGPQQSYWSPKLDVLSTGEVVAVGHYASNGVPFGPFSQQLAFAGSPSGMFVMKYTPENGIYDARNIATTGDASFYSGVSDLYNDIPRFVVDLNDNIIVSAYWQYGPQVTEIRVMDSIMDLASGTFVFSMNSNYDLNWLTVGSHSKVEDLEIIRTTGEALLLTKTKDNISFGNGMNHMMIGNTIDTTIVYTSYPNYNDYPWLHFGLSDLFLTKFDLFGVPIQMKKYNDVGLSNAIGYSGFRNTRLSATPCGDFAVVIHEAAPPGVITLAPGFEADGQYYQPDTTIALYYYDNCTLDNCSFVQSPDTIYQCSFNSSVQIQLCDYFNLDSLVYDVIENSIVTATNQSALVSNGLFSVPISAQGNSITLAISYPTPDTVVIMYSALTSPAYQFEDTICFGDPLIITADQLSYQYDWLNSAYSGNMLQLSSADYVVGTNLIDVKASTSDGCFVYDTVSISILDCANLVEMDASNISLMPNPNDGNFELRLSEIQEEFTIEIQDLTGRVVYQKDYNSSDRVLFNLELETGKYILVVRSEGRIYSKKIVIM